MREHDPDQVHGSEARRAAAGAERADVPGPTGLLAMQRTIGNASVTHLIQRRRALEAVPVLQRTGGGSGGAKRPRYDRVASNLGKPFDTDDIPAHLFRGDARSPEEIFGSGFSANGMNDPAAIHYNLADHVQGGAHGGTSGFISTTGSENIAQEFAVTRQAIGASQTYRINPDRADVKGRVKRVQGEGESYEVSGWVYEIDSIQNAVDVNAHLKDVDRSGNLTAGYGRQNEYAAVGRIPDAAIKSARLYEVTVTWKDGIPKQGDPTLVETRSNPNYAHMRGRKQFEPSEDPSTHWADRGGHAALKPAGGSSSGSSSDTESHSGGDTESHSGGDTEHGSICKRDGNGSCVPHRNQNDHAAGGTDQAPAPAAGPKSKKPLKELNGKNVTERAKAAVQQLDKEAGPQLPIRKTTGLDKEEIIDVTQKTHDHFGGAHVANLFNLAAYAYGIAETFRDKDATTLDKASAVSQIVPGLGSALGIADGIAHHDPETIAVNTIALGAFVVAQAVPVVGELVDAGLLAYAIVQGCIAFFGDPEKFLGKPAVDAINQAAAAWEENAETHRRVTGQPLLGLGTIQP